MLAERHGDNPKSVSKWEHRETEADRKTGPKQPGSTVLTPEEEAEVVAFRRTFTGGRVMMTSGVNNLESEAKARLLTAVRTFDRFDKDNDPHGEHDFGSTDIDGTKFFWKIDYYDLAMSRGSVDPANAAATMRVLTIMRADEY